ncbi:MAG: SdpI family protein [Butyrivibrio sp.]|nr:SdpI family protein [Muribaculum sp.]MCM1552649.1 SdpI family protein [Butyrivibrio sp.]
MIKKNKWQLIISSIIILLPVAAGLLIWNSLPEQMAIHWGFDGEADGWLGKGFAVFGIPLFLLAIYWIGIIGTAHDPKNKDQNSKVFNLVIWIVPIVSLVVCSFIYAIALGNDVNIVMIARLLLGFMFVLLGNYLPKCRQNNTIGIKVKWALQNEENWNKTHRFAGKLWVFGGVTLLLTLFINFNEFMYVVLLLVFIMAFAPMIYSYVYSRGQ